MSCEKPLARIEEWNGRVTFEHPGIIDNDSIKKWCLRIENQPHIKSAKIIPCRKCLSCKLDYAKNWANRITLEAKYYEYNYFVTLTYNNQNIPKNINPKTLEVSYTLCKKDVQNFYKRLREQWKRKYNFEGIRHFTAGEYGDMTMRPHYHAIIFNLPNLDDLKEYGGNENGDKLYRSEKLEKIWGKGNVIIGQMTWNSASYVARYVVKKQYGKEGKKYYERLGIIPEFVMMSNRPGIGYKYYEENKEKIYKYDEIYIPCKDDVVKIKPFRYYDNLYEKEHKKELKEIKYKRDREYKNKNTNLIIKKNRGIINEQSNVVQEQREINARLQKGKFAQLKTKL